MTRSAPFADISLDPDISDIQSRYSDDPIAPENSRDTKGVLLDWIKINWIIRAVYDNSMEGFGWDRAKTVSSSNAVYNPRKKKGNFIELK